MALKLILTVDINVIKPDHIFKAHVAPFSMWSDLQIRLVVVLVLQFSLKLPMIAVTASLTGLIRVISWENVKTMYIYSKKMQSVCLRSCHCHKKANVSAFEYLSSRKNVFPSTTSFTLHVGENTCCTKEWNIKWHFPVFSIWSFMVFMQEDKLCAVFDCRLLYLFWLLTIQV